MKATAEVDAFFATYPPQVEELAHELRRLVTATISGSTEVVDRSARLIGYGFGGGYKGLVCTIIPSKVGVKLGIFRGAELPDPTHLLEGSGKIHRHVAFKSIEDFAKPGLEPLLEAALDAWKRRTAAECLARRQA